MRALAVIPVRLAASRLPGKPLADLGGRPVVEWVHQRTSDTGVFDRVVVATPDREIAEVVESFGAEVEMTADNHATGTDRVAEVAQRLAEYDVVANIQGDQPFVDRRLLEALLRPYGHGDDPDMVTIGTPLSMRSYHDEHTVKVLMSARGDALYFSRSAIPHGVTPDNIAELPLAHHLGLYAFRSASLVRYSSLPSTPLETVERLEQLRMIEHGFRVRVEFVEGAHPVEINTASDLETAQATVRDGDEGWVET